MSADLHSPGGKSRFPLAPGVGGLAHFSEDGKHRLILQRWIEGEAGKPYALFIGMNPSEAGGTIDDPTVRREWLMTRERLELKVYVKANVFTYRATHPLELLKLQPAERSLPGNLTRIVGYAENAAMVIVCWGSLPEALKPAAGLLLGALRNQADLYCLGKTKDGSPKHGRGVSKADPLERFP